MDRRPLVSVRSRPSPPCRFARQKEFSDDGVIFRRSGKSPLLPWDEIAAVALVKAGGRTVLAYRLKPGVAVMKRHPGAGFLRAKGLDFDGGYFVDQMTASPQEILDVFQQHLGR